MHYPSVSRKIFVLDHGLTLTDDQIEGILEITVTKKGTSAKSDGNGDQE